MRYPIIILIVILFAGCSAEPEKVTPPGILSKIEHLNEQHNFFRLKTLYESKSDSLSDYHRLLYGALLKSAFFDHLGSTMLLDSLQHTFSGKLDRKEELILHKTLRVNYFIENDYLRAMKENSLILDAYADLIDSTEAEDLLNELKILETLQGVPPQELTKHADCLINLSKDSQGLVSANVEFGHQSSRLLFDTGFTMSSLKRSLAERLGLKVIPTDAYVHGASGNKVRCDIAIAPEIRISEITARNVVFYVFDDDYLSLPYYDIEINGVLGFPVIRAMEEIHIMRNSWVFIPKTTLDYDSRNLALKDMDPIIGIVEKNDTLPFYLDTGSAFTALYKQYYNLNKEEVELLYEKRVFQIGSIGGLKKIDCYKTDSLEFFTGDTSGKVWNAPVFAEYIYPEHMQVAGVLGQDFLAGFNTMIMSFNHASLILK